VSRFCWPARVYWEDTDGGGVVYYANYLRFLERARTEWLRARGLSQQTLAAEHSILFTVVALNIEYRRPARLDDTLLVTCEPRAEGAAAVSFGQHIYRDATLEESHAVPAARDQAELDERHLLASADVRVACVHARTFRPQRLPDFLVNALGAQERT
jgi:acyl-CoA thioester hydrolase